MSVAQSAEAIEEERIQYGAASQKDLDEKYPFRPHNHAKTLPFHDLHLELFNPLKENVRKRGGPVAARRKQGPHGVSQMSPNEMRRNLIEKFISKWRRDVGNDFYPAMRLIIPDKDRDRAMYGLKEKIIGKMLVRVLRIDKDSEDGFNLLNWKLPGQSTRTAMAGDFAGRCFEVISKRPIRTAPGRMTIAQVNEKLDQLSVASKEEDQLPIFEHFYRNMNPDELMWLIRIILRQIHIGATERTILEVWHPDAESLFNVSSSLRRVCWELYDPTVRLDGETRDITLMQCFQPQLAAFQMQSFEKMIARMKPEEDDDVFWIEEKLDGERMQMHMVEDSSVRGGRRFEFWSRKAKNYSYLYGSSLEDESGALTRYLKNAFKSGVRNIILDGEMIDWDMETDTAFPFGHLKTAAKAEQANQYDGKRRPMFRVFDCLYLNDKALTVYTLRDRRAALERSVNPQHRRIEIHEHMDGRVVADIERELRRVVAESSEGLVIKNPRSRYRLNDRNDDWIKVKPEYMQEFGEALDCVVIGGYYGSGKRGGNLSSFLCGLRMDQNQIQQGANPQKCFSFFKVGGGFSAADYAAVRHRTEGKWMKWDVKRPPWDWIELGGGIERQYERPDVWIKPEDSVVVEVKAASTGTTDQFRTGLTLRFPRFKKLRDDKTWKQALSLQGWKELKDNAEKEQNEKKFEIDEGRQKRLKVSKRKKPLVIAGAPDVRFDNEYNGPDTAVFEGLTFFIATESLTPLKKSKNELEQLVKANGGNVVQRENPEMNVIVIADRKLVKVASIVKRGRESVVKPAWLFDCIEQARKDGSKSDYILPMEPSHIFHLVDDDKHVHDNIDEFGDSYARDVTATELREIFDKMPSQAKARSAPDERLIDNLAQTAGDDDLLAGWMFKGKLVYIDGLQHSSTEDESVPRLKSASRIIRFGGGQVVDNLEATNTTHILADADLERLRAVKESISQFRKLPRVVSPDWVLDSWKEKTLLDEERYQCH